jgi:hypothetical protein
MSSRGVPPTAEIHIARSLRAEESEWAERSKHESCFSLINVWVRLGVERRSDLETKKTK